MTLDIHYIDENNIDCVIYTHDYEEAAKTAIILSMFHERAWVIGPDFQDTYEHGHHVERVYDATASNLDDDDI